MRRQGHALRATFEVYLGESTTVIPDNTGNWEMAARLGNQFPIFLTAEPEELFCLGYIHMTLV